MGQAGRLERIFFSSYATTDRSFCLRRFKKLCLCKASLVFSARLAVHNKQSSLKSPETKWPPCDKDLFTDKHFKEA